MNNIYYNPSLKSYCSKLDNKPLVCPILHYFYSSNPKHHDEFLRFIALNVEKVVHSKHSKHVYYYCGNAVICMDDNFCITHVDYIKERLRFYADSTNHVVRLKKQKNKPIYKKV